MRWLSTIELGRLDEVIWTKRNIDDLFSVSVYETEYHRDRVILILDPAVEHWAYQVATSLPAG